MASYQNKDNIDYILDVQDDVEALEREIRELENDLSHIRGGLKDKGRFVLALKAIRRSHMELDRIAEEWRQEQSQQQ